MSVKTKILIADDNDNIRRGIRNYLEMKGHEVFESATVKETIELIKKERFDIVVLDTCDMKGEGRGIEKVLEFIESESPTTQVIIHSALSATKYEPRFKNFKVAQTWSDKSSPLKSIEKIILSLTTKTQLSPLKIKIDNRELTITDPFDIPSAILVGMLDFEIYDKLYTTVYERYGEQINQKIIETGAKTLVVYKDNGEVKVAGKSNSPYYPSDEELEKIQQKVGKVCYVVGRDIIEENQCIEKSNWISITEMGENPYPTIPIYLGRLDEECKNIIRGDRLIISDFDTGNHNILAFKDEYRENLQIPSGQRRKKLIAYTLGGSGYYDYSVGSVQIGLCDSKDANRFCCAEFDVLFVLNWESSPFTRASPLRNAFVGRALWFPDKLRFSLILNAKDGKIMFSQVEL